MSFRLFVYYCMVGGAWCGFVGWVLGKLLAPAPAPTDRFFQVVLRSSLVAMFLGFATAFGLSFLDAAFNLSLRQIGKVLLRVVAAALVGVFGGLFGGFIGGALYSWITSEIVFLISWIILGFLVGMSIPLFQLFACLVARQDVGSAVWKLVKCAAGGTLGGVLGGGVALGLRFLAGLLTDAGRAERLWTPTALGFIAIGAFIGLLVGLAQVILKQAWIKVEAGFRPGREMLLQKALTSIGRAEGADIALFGDSGVEKAHANIVLDAGRYYLEDLQTPDGTFVNDQRVQGRTPLKSGDLIRVGASKLRFNEKKKREE